ncbi:hypothetical protein E2C01_048478 [Portunus trituberculatus]|uniref:Uncharacterized protein n=1 Tax=Portunus trituberculatus TaxID=210409 RepID=A0A5B7GB07_PORTR|nr:hypothetical protein [Portunus trituberculatus]
MKGQISLNTGPKEPEKGPNQPGPNKPYLRMTGEDDIATGSPPLSRGVVVVFGLRLSRRSYEPWWRPVR